MLNEYFSPYDVDHILGIRLPRFPVADFIGWHYEKTGVFSVKSAYRLAMEELWNSTGNWTSSSTSQSCRPLWKRYWSIPVPHKVPIFGWKVINNGLATQESKRKRNIVSTGRYEICGGKDESTAHALVGCDHAQALREAMRQVWVLPDEQQYWQISLENLLTMIDGMDVDGAQGYCCCFGEHVK